MYIGYSPDLCVILFFSLFFLKYVKMYIVLKPTKYLVFLFVVTVMCIMCISHNHYILMSYLFLYRLEYGYISLLSCSTLSLLGPMLLGKFIKSFPLD